MAKRGASTAVPRLRFPEFRGTQPWKPYALIELADKRVKWSFAGGPFGSNLKASDYTSRGVRIIQLQNIGDGEFLNGYKIYTSTSKADELLSSNIYPGEILLSKMGDPVGRACIVPESEERYVMCSDGIRLVVDERKFSRDFAFFAINFDGFRRRVEAAATGSTRKRIGLDALKQLPLDAPQLAEQQNVADCLISLDEVIAGQGRKVDALKAHKRGLMQQLFPREGETSPRLRFPEFRGKWEWKEGTIGGANAFVTSGSRGWANYYADNGALFVRITNLSRETISLDLADQKFVDLPPEATEGVRTLLKPDDVLISITADIGITGYVDPADPTPAYINQHIALVRFDEQEVSGKFVAYYLASELAQRRFRATTDSGAKAGMNLIAIQNTKLVLPSLAEQQRIANCLSSIDTQISAESTRISALKTHKQGLMQQLFPVAEKA